MKFLENKILENLCNKIQWQSSAVSNSVGRIGDCCRIVSRSSPRRSWLLRDDPLVVADFFKKIPRRSWLWLPSLLLWREPRASLGRPSPALTIGHSDSSIRWGVFFIAICILFIIAWRWPPLYCWPHLPFSQPTSSLGSQSSVIFPPGGYMIIIIYYIYNDDDNYILLFNIHGKQNHYI